MIDPLSASLLAIAAQSPSAVGLIFVAGSVTSIGPCVAPRYIAIAAIANGYRQPIVPTLAFVGGLLGAFMLLGFGAGAIGSIWSSSALLYGLLAGALLVAGSVTLVRAIPHRCSDTTCSADHAPGYVAAGAGRKSLGGVFLLGAASALIVSPCCTPIVAGIVATTVALGKPIFGVVLLASFALGHALPLFFAGTLASLVRRTVRWHGVHQTPAIIGGTLMIALGAYYGILA